MKPKTFDNMIHPKANLCNVCLNEKLSRKYFSKKMLCDIYAESVVNGFFKLDRFFTLDFA